VERISSYQGNKIPGAALLFPQQIIALNQPEDITMVAATTVRPITAVQFSLFSCSLPHRLSSTLAITTTAAAATTAVKFVPSSSTQGKMFRSSALEIDPTNPFSGATKQKTLSESYQVT
jgi:hypothetical protein